MHTTNEHCGQCTLPHLFGSVLQPARRQCSHAGGGGDGCRAGEYPQNHYRPHYPGGMSELQCGSGRRSAQGNLSVKDSIYNIIFRSILFILLYNRL